MGEEFDITPKVVPTVETPFRRIASALPHPDSVPILQTLRRCEPLSMRGQPPLVWDRAEDFSVYDKYGNRWIDWSSGVLVANAGHAAPEVRQAIIDQVQRGLLHNYVFPSAERARLAEYVLRLSPAGLNKVFFLTTGAEAVECALKLARARGLKLGGSRKIGLVGAERGFHGRTLGAQQAGGLPEQKQWIVNQDPAIVQVPFPDGYWTVETSFGLFVDTLKRKGLGPKDIAGVIFETYQGVGPDFAPRQYMQDLAQWCRNHQVVLILDEVQSGFGRTGKIWAFEHYGIIPDLICCGKGISSSLPISAVIGREEIMDQFPPGSMTSTHSGNPVCAAAALASLKKIVSENLTGKAERMGAILERGLAGLRHRHAGVIGHHAARGLVGGLQMVRTGRKEPDAALAHNVVERCFQKGLLLFAPVGAWGQTIKIAPPLTITEEPLREGLAVLGEALDEACAAL
jgi:4-aminobutyrate aminotransferase / (S)-3-amino-2-methylpropionate transaminase / 5-aminovalerate transaminase